MASEFIPISTGSLTLKANFFSLADGNVWNGSSFVDPHLSALATIAGWRTALSEIKDSSDAVTIGYELAIPAGITIPVRIAVYTSDAVATETWGGEYDPQIAQILEDTGTTIPATLGVAGAGLTAIPWNAAWDAEVQSECTDALNAYDPPTNAEMEARTLVAANYGTAANQTTIVGYVDCLPATWVTVPTAAQIRTEVLAKGAANDQAVAEEDSLITLILAGFHSEIVGGVWTIYRTDDATTHATKTVTASASADPITGVN